MAHDGKCILQFGNNKSVEATIYFTHLNITWNKIILFRRNNIIVT